jgi:hypothetical protein
MPFPCNRVILSILADVDFLALLTLTGCSASLYHFILDQVVTSSCFLHFLHGNQYTLHHDDKYRLFSQKEIMLLFRVFNTLQRRHGSSFYEETIGVLGPLLSCIPIKMFEKQLPNDYNIPTPPDRKGRVRGVFTLEHIRDQYNIRLQTSWMHLPTYFSVDGQGANVTTFLHLNSPDPFLQEDILFCKRYVDDFNTYFCLSYALKRPRNSSENVVLDSVHTIRKMFAESGGNSWFEKRCIQGLVAFGFRPRFVNEEIIPTASEKAFQVLFELDGWMEMWTPAELGWWFAFGLTQWPEVTQRLINTSFKSKSETLIWLFLGAHHWFHTFQLDRWDSDESNNYCCPTMSHGCEREFIMEYISSVSPEDRIWIVRQIVRRAPEFGVCRELGANLFSYFVVHDLTHADIVLSTLLDEICDSRLQYIFEYAISLAITEYQHENGVILLKLEMSRKYMNSLLRRDTELYSLLKRSDIS